MNYIFLLRFFCFGFLIFCPLSSNSASDDHEGVGNLVVGDPRSPMAGRGLRPGWIEDLVDNDDVVRNRQNPNFRGRNPHAEPGDGLHTIRSVLGGFSDMVCAAVDRFGIFTMEEINFYSEIFLALLGFNTLPDVAFEG